jgi:hypothetical protein
VDIAKSEQVEHEIDAFVAYHEAEAEKYRDHDTKESAA